MNQILEFEQTEKKTTYLLVDVMNLLHRSLFAVRGDAATKAGLAMHITLASIKKAWTKFGASHVVFCLEGRSWRKEIYPEYKANRVVVAQKRSSREQEEVEYFFSVMDEFIEFINNKTNITVLKSVGLEADDWIAGWIRAHPNANHIIVSTDTDFIQLLAPNVLIYEGVKEMTITTTGIFNDAGKRMSFILKSDTKIGIGDPDENFIVEPNWWKRALFYKIVRGDRGDNIFPAFPGVREKASKKNPGLKEAYEDQETRGYSWNNLMLQSWTDHNGNLHKVVDRFEFNRQLIDLNCQPVEIKELMNQLIEEKKTREPVRQVGIWLMKFCEEHQLINIGKNVAQYSEILSTPYNGR